MFHTAFRTIAPVAALAAVGGCATCDRVGQDALVVATFPVHAVTTPATRTQAQIEDDGASPWVGPVLFAGKFGEDVGVTLISALDVGISPVLGLVEVSSDDPKAIRPLGMYKFREFPPTFVVRNARAAEYDVAIGTLDVSLLLLWMYVECHADRTGPREPRYDIPPLMSRP